MFPSNTEECLALVFSGRLRGRESPFCNEFQMQKYFKRANWSNFGYQKNFLLADEFILILSEILFLSLLLPIIST